MTTQLDVAIIGGGPAGSTCGGMLAKYNRRLKVGILEREKFPRDHVGESQLPFISTILNELGVWDKVEQANFPIKIGATYRWGTTPDLWDFEFIPSSEFQDTLRPAKFEGPRRKTAFQVDRAIYDKILLDHAKGLGCRVQEETVVRAVERDGDRVTGLVLDNGDRVEARYYVDCSGHAGIIRRAMGVEVASPTTLQNIAIWDYWQNAEWATSIGIGGTRVQVMSVSYGWIWFIPLGPTRTSVGLIVPATYYKECGKKPAELYAEAIAAEPLISSLLKQAEAEGKLATTKDWSFLSDRLAGENWFLAGESAGFADPILAAGMTLAHSAGRDVAYTIMALDRKDYEADWLRSRYDETHRKRIGQHIRFADFWYTANGQFTDLIDFTRTIAADAGLTLEGKEAWQWLGTGGFINEDSVNAGIGGYNLAATKGLTEAFTGEKVAFSVSGKNVFRLDLEGAEKGWVAWLSEGRINRARCHQRDGRSLPTIGTYQFLLNVLKQGDTLAWLEAATGQYIQQSKMPEGAGRAFGARVIEALEAMVSDGWVHASTDPELPTLP
ncbi:MAG: NAD(P)/FAD-dependent oxidoreductase [Fimbriimonas sp.]